MRRLGALLFAVLILGWGGAEAAGESVDIARVVDRLVEAGDTALAGYHPEAGVDTADRFSDLYFDVFEGSGMERAVGLRDSQLKTDLEGRFAAVIGAAGAGRPRQAVNEHWQTLRSGLIDSATRFGNAGQSGFWATLLQAFLILLREGFEAMLVITALVAYLRKSGAGEKIPVIYHGAGWALLASLVTAYLLTVVFDISGAGQEALEGITMLVAAAVLFYVSYWLVSKREAARWQAYVKQKIDSALSRGSLFALGLAAFLAVYREGAETVLFYQALLGQSDGRTTAIAGGFVIACVVLVGVYWAMRSAAVRLPLGLFFGITATLLYYLAVSFAGHGILELQEAGWVSISPVAGAPQVPLIGLFPTWEGIGAQLVLLIPLIPALLWWKLKRNRAMEAGAG